MGIAGALRRRRRRPLGRRCRQELRRLRSETHITTGHAFVVFEREEDRVKLLHLLAAPSARKAKGFFADVAEWWVAEVVGQCNRLREVVVAAQPPCDTTAHLGDLERVGHATAKVVAFKSRHDLRLVLHPTKGRCVQDAISVALERGAKRVLGFG